MLDFAGLDTITPTEYTRYVYIDRILADILKRRKIDSLCDAGCGTGNLLSVLRGYGFRGKGIDISEECLDIARKKLGPRNVELEKKDIFELDGQYDLVILSEVLEHIDDDKGLLAHLGQKIIKKGGLLMITVPAHGLLYSAFDKSVGHVRRYNKKALASLLETSGFKPVVFWSYGSVLFHLIANLSMGNTGRGPKKDLKTDLFESTKKSALREFSPVMKMFVSKVNILHRIFLILDLLFKNLDMGIEYCVLCEKQY